MNIIEKTEGRYISHQVMMGTWIMLNNQLMYNLANYETDEKNIIDICMDNTGSIANTLNERYAAQIVIPARQYKEIAQENDEEIENELGEEATENIVKEPIPFDIDNVTLVLWGY